MKLSVACSIAVIEDSVVTEFGASVVVVLRGTLIRLEEWGVTVVVTDGDTVVMRFWEGFPYFIIRDITIYACIQGFQIFVSASCLHLLLMDPACM